MLKINQIHHIAIICSDIKKSKKFYNEILGFKVKSEVFRKARNSFKVDLTLNNSYLIEMFSFPNPPKRISMPEAVGLRHLAFEVDNILEAVSFLQSKLIEVEVIRIDEFTNKQFTFFLDPDFLPIEIYEK
jgi:glyoxylase I family protein